MNLLAAALTMNSFALDDGPYQIKPLAVLVMVRQAKNAGWTKRTNRETGAQPIAMDELLDGRLVRAVVARRSRRMVFVERSILKDLLVDGACREEDEPLHLNLSCRFN